ncbi:MAG: LacI family transcriptional regulator, partial [Actinomyces sp.]
MEDVARRAGVSRALVSLVMNDSPKVSPARRAAVLAAARELGYRPDLNARNLAQRRTHTLGVLLNDIHNPFFTETVDGLDVAAREAGQRLLILHGARDPEREREAVETFLQLRVEGLVLVGTRIAPDDIAEIAAATPTVLVASGDAPGVDTVVTDDRLGAAFVVEHLVRLGHRRIAHVDGGDNVSAAERRQGYLAAMAAAGLADRAVVATGGDDDSVAAAAVDELLADDDPLTAVFAFNDIVATGVLDRLDDLGLGVPDRVSVVG